MFFVQCLKGITIACFLLLGEGRRGERVPEPPKTPETPGAADVIPDNIHFQGRNVTCFCLSFLYFISAFEVFYV